MQWLLQRSMPESSVWPIRQSCTCVDSQEISLKCRARHDHALLVQDDLPGAALPIPTSQSRQGSEITISPAWQSCAQIGHGPIAKWAPAMRPGRVVATHQSNEAIISNAESQMASRIPLAVVHLSNWPPAASLSKLDQSSDTFPTMLAHPSALRNLIWRKRRLRGRRHASRGPTSVVHGLRSAGAVPSVAARWALIGVLPTEAGPQYHLYRLRPSQQKLLCLVVL